MTKATALPPDAAPIPTAAKLLGLHPERVRQLVKLGYAQSPSRGIVNLASLLSGYARFLKSEADRPASDAVGRGHDAKAKLIRAETERRRAELMPRTDAEAALDFILQTAKRRLRGMVSAHALKGLPPATQEATKAEVSASLERIMAVHAATVAALRTGDFTGVVGKPNDS